MKPLKNIDYNNNFKFYSEISYLFKVNSSKRCKKYL